MSMLSITEQNLEGFPRDWRKILRNYSLQTVYGQIGTVYACVNVIANTISGVEMGFFADRPVSGNGQPGSLPPGGRAPMSRGWFGYSKIKRLAAQQKVLVPLPEQHGLVRLFNPPNRVETPSLTELIKFTSIMLSSDGEAFWVLEKKGQREPQDVRLVRGSKIKEVLSRDRSDIQGWIETDPTRPGDRGRPLTLDEVVPFKLPNPYNKWRGLSPLAAARLAVEQDFNMSVWNAGFFQGGVRNPIAVLIKQKLEPKQRKEMEKNIRDHYQGFVKGQGPLLLDKGATIQNLTFSAKDIDFIEGKNLSREDLCSIYGVPPALIGVYRYANYANSEAQQQIFWKNTVIPIMVYVADTVQVNLIDVYWKGAFVDWYWEDIDALKDNPREVAVAQRQIAEAVKVYAELGYSAAQIAFILDRPELDPSVHPGTQLPAPAPALPEGRTGKLITSQSFLPLPSSSPEESGGAARPTPPVPSKDSEVEPPIVLDDGKGWIIIKASDRFLEAYQAAVERQVLNPETAQMARTVRAFLDQASSTIVRRVERGSDGYLNPGIWMGVWMGLNEKNVRSSYFEGLRRAFMEIAAPEKALNGISKQQRVPLADLLDDYQLQVAQRAIEDINNLTRDPIGLMLEELNAVTRTNILAGASVQELRAALEDRVEELYRGRALTISRTTSGGAYSSARQQMFEAKGVKIHQWAASNDAHVRATHNRERGNRVPVGERFPITNLRYPLDPTGRAEERINCRCTTFPVAVKRRPDDRTTLLPEEAVPPDQFQWKNAATFTEASAQFRDQLFIRGVSTAARGLTPEIEALLTEKANAVGRETARMYNRLPGLQRMMTELEALPAGAKYRQVQSVDFVYRDRLPGQGNATGTYWSENKEIALAVDRKTAGSAYTISTKARPSFNATVGVEGTWRHEYGHYIDDIYNSLQAHPTAAVAEKYAKLVERWELIYHRGRFPIPPPEIAEWWRTNVSSYSATNIREAFAESFSIFSSSKYGTKGFPKLPKEIEDFMRDLFM
jgi:HK97 family phage portal protein